VQHAAEAAAFRLKTEPTAESNAFLCDGDDPCDYVRLNFSTPSDEDIVKGVKILGEVAKTY